MSTRLSTYSSVRAVTSSPGAGGAIETWTVATPNIVPSTSAGAVPSGSSPRSTAVAIIASTVRTLPKR
jgi:hypothetical protein